MKTLVVIDSKIDFCFDYTKKDEVSKEKQEKVLKTKRWRFCCNFYCWCWSESVDCKLRKLNRRWFVSFYFWILGEKLIVGLVHACMFSNCSFDCSIECYIYVWESLTWIFVACQFRWIMKSLAMIDCNCKFW